MPANSTFTEMVTTTYRHHGGTVADNLTENNALARYIKKSGNIKTIRGGYEIALPLDYNANSNYIRMNGYQPFSIDATEAVSAAKYDLCEAAIAITTSRREMLMNNGDEQLIDMVKTKVVNSKRTAANNMSIDLYSDGALTNQIGGLAHQITQDGTGTVGGIVAGTYTFWKNQFVDMTSPSATNIIGYMNQLWLTLVRGSDKPDVIVSSHDLYNYYWSALQANQRYTNTSEKASAGFSSLAYVGDVPVIFDDNSNFTTTTEDMYFLNTKYLFMMEHADARWTEQDARTPINQLASIIVMHWMGQLCNNGRQFQGLLFDT